MLILTLLILACSSQPSEPSQPSSPVHELQNKIQTMLALEDPEEITRYCRLHQESQIQDLCKRYFSRPHLYNAPPKNQRKQTVVETKPSPRKTSCESANNPFLCLENRAKNHENLNFAIRECSSIDDKKWKAECFFQLAENWVLRPNKPYSEGVKLCNLSAIYVDRCLQHLTLRLGSHMTDSLQQSVVRAVSIKKYWNQYDFSRTAKELDLFWYTKLATYHSRSNSISGELFFSLPQEAQPHLWSIFGLELLKQHKESRHLDEWTAELLLYKKSKMVLEYPKQDSPKRQAPQSQKSINNKTMVHYFENKYRLLGESTEEDIQIALVSAAKDLPAHQNLLDEGAFSPYNLVQLSLQ